MRKLAPLLSALLIPYLYVEGQTPINNQAVPVEIVATASEYVPKTTTISHPGHAYTDCHGSTSYLGDFSGFEDANGRISGDVSGTATTDARCKTTFTSPTETSVTHYDRVNYIIARNGQTLYLLACTQKWTLNARERFLAGYAAGSAGATGESPSDAASRVSENARGTWTKCPAFTIGAKYTLTVRNTSDARLDNGTQRKPDKLDYLSSAPVPTVSTPAPAESEAAVPGAAAKVHITSTPTGGEIYIDGKFYGNAPSDITLPAGEHVVKVTLGGGKDWTRSVQVTSGEIQLHASAELVTGTGGPTPVPTGKATTVTTGAAPPPKSVTVQSVEPSKDASSATAPTSAQRWIGVTTTHFGSGGAVVTAVAAGSPAANAGLRSGDVINTVNGISLKDEDLDKKIAADKPGSTVRLGYMRGPWALEAVVTVATKAR